MFVPLHDTNPLKTIPFQYVTVALIIANVAVWLIFGTDLGFRLSPQVTADFALIPIEFLRDAGLKAPSTSLPQEVLPVPESLTLVTYMFFHGNFWHLAGNMLFLWVFGDNVEDAMGHLRFLFFYLACGIAGGLAHSLSMSGSDVPLIGASGAVAGVIAAYLMLHPKVKVWVLVLFRIPLRLTAAWALGFWVVWQFFNAAVANGDNIAWWAHIGGLVAGAVLILFMRRPGVLLFDRTAGGA